MIVCTVASVASAVTGAPHRRRPVRAPSGDKSHSVASGH